MRRCGPFLCLEVPGLSEGRPSLLMGDRAIVCEPGEGGGAVGVAGCVLTLVVTLGGDETTLHWEGYIHEVSHLVNICRFIECLLRSEVEMCS